MAQIAEPHRRAELVHLRICANAVDALRILDAEILQLVEFLAEVLITEAGRAALDRMEDLRRMKAETAHITEGCRAPPLVRHAERMRRIIEHLELVLVRDALDFLYIADIAIDMHRHDSACPICDQALDFRHVHREILRIHIAEYRRQPISHDGMRRRSKRERRRDDFALQVHRLQRELQRHMPVREEIDIRHAEKLPQRRLQCPMLRPHIRQPVRLPDVTDFVNILLQRRHRRTSYQNLVFHHIITSLLASRRPFSRKRQYRNAVHPSHLTRGTQNHNCGL